MLSIRFREALEPVSRIKHVIVGGDKWFVERPLRLHVREILRMRSVVLAKLDFQTSLLQSTDTGWKVVEECRFIDPKNHPRGSQIPRCNRFD
jgi:peptide subunit release factor 1 (eRF1)